MDSIIAINNLVKLQEPGVNFNFRRFRVGKNDQLNEVTGFGRVIRLLLNVLSFGQVDRNVRDVYNKSIIAVKFANPDAPAAKEMLEVLQKRSFTKRMIASDLNGKDINAIFQQVHAQVEVPDEDEQPSTEYLEPGQIPWPAPDPEELAEIKKDAQDHNKKYAYLLSLDTVPLQVILSKLTDPEDLKNIALTSEKLAQQVELSIEYRTAQARKTIENMIDFANRFNNEIQRITNGVDTLIGKTYRVNAQAHMFNKEPCRFHAKFDVQRWQDTLQNITNLAFAVDADYLARNCRLNLVESLAEYNVNPNITGTDPGDELSAANRPISQIDINNLVNGLNPEKRQMLTEVLDEAKATLKGDMCIATITSETPAAELMLPLTLKGHIEGEELSGGPLIFVHMMMMNRENPNWGHSGYKRAPEGYIIRIDELFGMYEGDPLVLPYGREGTGDKQIILRCNQSYFLLGPTFQRQVIGAVLSANFGGIEKLEDAYGKELVDVERERFNRIQQRMQRRI